ncbi:MAG: hypothetical protein AAGA11_04805 [Pseudomonadota bacterium]
MTLTKVHDRDPAQRAPSALGFLRWQCRVRQMRMRDHGGKPDDSMMPVLSVRADDGSLDALGQVMTVLNRLPEHSMVPEMQHISRKTFDPAKRREDALRLLCSTYYQKAQQFSDMVTASFGPESEGAVRIQRARFVTLTFDKYAQRVDLRCKVWRLTQRNYYWQATYWHNGLFNPGAPSDAIVLGFEPDWSSSVAEPPFHV